jgi:NADH-quinone oxidoreductase subunit G/NADP-reducing hydrogenase subunit HndD
MIEIKIDNQKINTEEGKTILEVAIQNGIKIPALCYHSDLTPKESCRLCVVKIEGRNGLFPSCTTLVEDGMEIITDDEEINSTRKTNLELLFSEHVEQCGDCVWASRCKMLELSKKLGIRINEFEERKKDFKEYNIGDIFKFDSSKCINCSNCVEMCEKQGVGFLEIKKEDNFYRTVPSKDKECVYCGQCVVHCPSGTFETNNPAKKIMEEIENGKYVVFQFAPAIRTSIGEEFGMDYGEVVIDKMVAGIKQLGAKKVFDVSVGADFCVIEEAKELIERLEKKENLPMFTSCCPAWVRFVEVYKPEFKANLTTTRSPHIILGGMIKTYFAEKEGIDPKDIIVVSVMPCLSKKYEITREELKVDGLDPVDYVLTTHELSRLLISKKIDLKNIVGIPRDPVLGIPSSAGVIFGASGGVAESALRTAYRMITKDNVILDYKEVRGMEEVKEAKVKIGEVELKLAVVNGLGNAKKLLESNYNDYDYIEVMSCPGGCIGGGGQPVPTNSEIRKKRAEGLYRIDEKDANRLADDNLIVKEIYAEFLNSDEIIKKICYTKFK